MKRKNLIYAVVAIVLIVVSLFIILYENGIFKKSGIASDAFAIKDTSAVSKIFMADMSGNTVLISRTPKGWIVGDSLLAMPEQVRDLLGTMRNLMIRGVVAEAAQSNINTMMAVGAIKVEVYEIKPKFSLFGFKFQEKERLSKVYYMGGATQDNLGNYAVLEGMNEVYILYKPGFRGFVTPQFSPFEYEWYSHKVFETKLTRIQKLQIIDDENPSESFTIEKAGPRHFNVYDFENQRLTDYDTTKMLDMLSEFRNKNYESIAIYVSQGRKDTLLRNYHFKQMILTDVDGKITKMDLYRMPEKDIIQDENAEVSINDALSQDRFYAIMNGDTKTLYRMQFQHFERQVQPLSYFLKGRM